MLALVALVGVAYLLAHFVVGWVQRRLLALTGIEYILLGVLLGPEVVPQLHLFDDLGEVAPIIAFAAGWVGLLYGMELDLRALAGRRNPDPVDRASLPSAGDSDSAEAPSSPSPPSSSLRLAIVETALTAGAVALCARVLLTSGLLGPPIVGHREAWVCASVLGCTAAAGSSSAVDLLRARYQAVRSELLPLLRRTARLEDLLSIVVFGLVFCAFHVGSTRTEVPPVFSDWVLLTVGLGLALGFLFATFLGDDDGENSRFLALVGILVFASGAAFFLNLSALLVNLVLGMVIVNTRHGAGVFRTLEGTQAPVRLVLLVFAGVLWRPVDPVAVVVLAVACSIVRVAAKAFGCWLAALGTSLRADLFRGLLAQGQVAVAMAISFRLVYEGPAVDLAYSAILASVVVDEWVAPRLLRGLLVDSGELRQDVDAGWSAPARTG